MESQNHLTPEETALQHEPQIVETVAKEFGFPLEELKLNAASSFESESGDGSVSFFVQHKTGLYGVNATIQPDGTLGNITTANLQSSYYREER